VKFKGQKKNGKAVFPPAIAELKRRAWEKVPEGMYFETSLVVPRNPKSYAQVKTHWGMVIGAAILKFADTGVDTSFIFNLETPTGNPITGDQLTAYLYEVCPIYNDDGKKITLSRMNTEQASRFFETCRNHLASRFGVVIPDPNPEMRSKK